jgi:hypothetical protein
MDYSMLTPVLVEAVKALKEECDERDSRVKALESELASLKERLRRLELTGGLSSTAKEAPAAEVAAK